MALQMGRDYLACGYTGVRVGVESQGSKFKMYRGIGNIRPFKFGIMGVLGHFRSC